MTLTMIEILFFRIWGVEIKICFHLSQRSLKKRIKKVLCVLTSFRPLSLALDELAKDGCEINVKRVQYELLCSTVSVQASEEDISNALISISSEGVFEGGPTKSLKVDVIKRYSFSPHEFILKSA